MNMLAPSRFNASTSTPAGSNGTKYRTPTHGVVIDHQAPPSRLDLSGIGSVPALCDLAFNTYRSGHCLASRESGHWRWLATEDVQCEVRRLSLGMLRSGVAPGSRVALIGDPSPHWVIADLAIMAIGAVTVPLFPTMSAEHLRHAISHTATRAVIVLGASGWQRVVGELGRFRVVIVRGAGTTGGRVLAWHDVQSLGDTVSYEDPGLYARSVAHLRPDDVATIIHTSGSTGLPKGVELTHRNLVMQIRGATEVFPLAAGRDRALSCLPLAHVFERVVVYTYMAQGAPVYFADDVKNVGALLRDVKPAVIAAVPRLIEKLHARIRTQVAESVVIKRQLGHWALEMANRTETAERSTKPLALRIADRLIYSKLRQALGGELKYFIVGGAALSAELQRFLAGVGIPCFTGYGMTEASPVISVNRPGSNRIGTVGQAFPGVQIRIAADGEIQALGANIMHGYHADAAASAQTMTPDGWLRTGDCGQLDADGFLTITGRAKELFKTSNGKYVAPVPLEQALIAEAQEAGGLIDQAMIVAEGRPCVGALLFADGEAVRRRKQLLGFDSLSDSDFLARAEIASAIHTELAQVIERVNASMDHWQHVRCWYFVTVPPSIDRDELTPTMKLRRHVLTQRYQVQIDDMYAQRPQVAGGDHG